MARKVYKAKLDLPGDAGKFLARFATLNVIDHDGDVTVPGAFIEDQRVVIEGWNHSYGLPVGGGAIHSDDKAATVDGRFFLDTTAGRDHYNTIKALGDVEFSYTFDVLDSDQGTFDGQRVCFLRELDVWGISPVTCGAGIDTGLIDLKRRRGRLTVQDVLLDIRLLEIDLKQSPGRLTVQDALFDIHLLEIETDLARRQAQQTPARVFAHVEDELIDVEIADLEARVKARSRKTHPTNLDRLHNAVIARYGSGHSRAWIAAMVAGALQQVTGQIYAQQEDQGGVSPNWAVAMRQVAVWARQPAR